MIQVSADKRVCHCRLTQRQKEQRVKKNKKQFAIQAAAAALVVLLTIGAAQPLVAYAAEAELGGVQLLADDPQEQTRTKELYTVGNTAYENSGGTTKGNGHDCQHLDLWVIDKLRVAFGNRILKQMNLFVPVYVACGGEELEGIDYVLATKIFRKFEALNLAMLRDELKELCVYLQKLFGKNSMKESVAYLERLQKLY